MHSSISTAGASRSTRNTIPWKGTHTMQRRIAGWARLENQNGYEVAQSLSLQMPPHTLPHSGLSQQSSFCTTEAVRLHYESKCNCVGSKLPQRVEQIRGHLCFSTMPLRVRLKRRHEFDTWGVEKHMGWVYIMHVSPSPLDFDRQGHMPKTIANPTCDQGHRMRGAGAGF